MKTNQVIDNEIKKVKESNLKLRLTQKELCQSITTIINEFKVLEVKYKEYMRYLEDEINLTSQQISKYYKIGSKAIGRLDTENLEDIYRSLNGKKKVKLNEIDKIKRVITTLFNKVEKNNLSKQEKVEIINKVKEVLSLLVEKEVKK